MEATITDRETSVELEKGLAAALGNASGARAAVGLWQAARGTAYAAFANGPTAPVEAARRPVRLGCIAKLATGALVERGRRAGAFDLDTDLGEALGEALGPAARAKLEGITLRHALEHRHGLDDSLLGAVPRTANGRIDTVRLCAALGRRLFRPGRLYSYSNAGAWLCAALLERLGARPYGSLLLDWARTQGLELHAASSAEPLCPALGGTLAMPLESLLRFARAQVDAPLWRERAHPAPLPGWNPLERGVLRGFKAYAGGWFGHQSVRPDDSVWLCFQPERRQALVVASGRHAAPLVALKLLGRRLPGLVPEPAPARLSPEATRAARPATGRYATRARRIEIAAGPGQPATAHCRGHRARLRAAERGVFYLEPPAPRWLPFVQFVESPAESESARYLWNGRQIYAPLERGAASAGSDAGSDAASDADPHAGSEADAAVLRLIGSLGC